MFSPTEDQSRSPRPWRAALRNAAELVVAFATLDSYPLSRAPHGSPAGADAPLFDLDDERFVWQPPAPSTGAPRANRTRRAGATPRPSATCLQPKVAPRSTRHAEQRARGLAASR